MKRITVTLADDVARYADDWAQQSDRPLSNLIAYLVEKSIEQAIENGRYQPRPEFESNKGTKVSDQKSDETLKQLGKALEALANGDPLPRNVCVSELASNLGIETEVITRLWKLTNGNSKAEKHRS